MCAPPETTESTAPLSNEAKAATTTKESTMESTAAKAKTLAIEIAERVSSASAAYRKPPSFVPSYGTAGFRAEASLLPSTLFRCGVLMAARSASLGNAVTGICVTASHNPPRDNGVKLIDASGNVLSQSWEPKADALARASDDEGDENENSLGGLTRALFEETLSELGTGESNPRPVVWIAHDSRPSSPGLAAAAKAGAEAAIAGDDECRSAVVILGEMTTPQLHWLVAEANKRMKENEKSNLPTLEDYYRELAGGHAELVDGTAPLTTTKTSPLFVDAAAGVGGAASARLAELVSPAGFSIVVANGREVAQKSPEALNCRRGSDFVQKTRELPDGMSVAVEDASSASGGDSRSSSPNDSDVVAVPPGAMCASLDGDADRVVFFTAPNVSSSSSKEEEGKSNNSKEVSLLDGDRIASLLAHFVKEKILAGLKCVEGGPELTLGQVQTSYANGAARAFALSSLTSPSSDAPPPPPLSKTGVKHLHAAAEKFDVGVYFEANGHGALLLSERFLRVARRQREREAKQGTSSSPPTPARLALALAKASNQAVGDALSGLLLVDAALRHLRWGFEEWRSMYEDLPSRQLVVRVRDRTVVSMSEDESRAVAPRELVEAVDAAVERANGNAEAEAGAGAATKGSRGKASARAFARPSGTEDVVRVYAEAPTSEGCELLALEVARAVWDHAGGVGERP